MAFVFLHVGAKSIFPTLLVRSIRKLLPDAAIIQCTDGSTPDVEGVTSVRRFSGDTENIMAFRLSCFCALGLEEPAIYLDTDMLMVRPLDPGGLLEDHDVAVCERSFDKRKVFDTPFIFNGLDFSEYSNKALSDVYPYIGCFTATRSHSFWLNCREEMSRLPEKFHTWFGDQEAIRNVVRQGQYRCKMAPERVYACLPEYRERVAGEPRVLHFKGAIRKIAMFRWARRLKLGKVPTEYRGMRV